MPKHRKGYFKGKYKGHLLSAYTAYRKSTERVTNKDIAKELGVSVSTFQKIKSGKSQQSKKSIEIEKQISKHTSRAGHLTTKGKILYRAVKKSKEQTKKNKPIKELTNKQINKIKSKIDIEAVEFEEIYEAFYEGES